MADEITRISASRLSQAIKSRDVSCVEVMQAYLERIHRYNPLYNAIVSLVDDSTLFQQAEAADKALLKGEYWGWMHGMPHAIKDLADAQGLVSTYGSPIFAQNVAVADSLPVAR
ncbi:MAG: amidase family protein, partial [Luminiphilus sp.]